LPAFPKGVVLVPAGDNRFRAVASSGVTIDFDATESRVRGLTLQETDGSGQMKLTKFAWNP
jgi:hypothetical protein